MTTLEKKLHGFIEALPIERLVQKLDQDERQGEENSARLLGLYANEAIMSLRMIEPYLNKNERILEVGAGLCLLTFFLKQEGYTIVALEPASENFGLFRQYQEVLTQHFADLHLHILPYRAEELVVESSGRFGLIFSFNVLEHVPRLTQSLVAMLEVMEENGRMVHSCANYFVPYEPHFRVLVLKFAPWLSRIIYWKRIAERRELWDSLNFITYSEVVKFARSHHLHVSFAKGLLHDAILRIGNDKFFRNRHGKMMFRVYNWLQISGMIRLLKYLPPAFATPMTFTVTRS